MKHLLCILILEFTTALALGQSAAQSKPPTLPNQPEALVRSLYTEVVSHHPHDIPDGADMEIFAPYLSKALLHRIDLAKACSADWDRQNPEPHMTTGYGLFSGDGEQAEPGTFHIKKVHSENDGSMRVFVNLTLKPPSRPYTWPVAAVVLRESGHYVIDDVIYINDAIYDNAEAKPPDRRLSEYLSAGCDGSHWIGYSLPTQPETLIRSLYQRAVARRPVGIPSGADWKAFAPYLSKSLLHRIDLALACGEDWDRQDQRRMLMKGEVIEKPPLAWLELGIFSGGDAESELHDFQIDRTEPENDGSFRVQVGLTRGWPPEKPWISHVAPILVRENARLVVDDVIYLRDEKDESSDDDRLTHRLSFGCDGPRWVGDPPNHPKE